MILLCCILSALVKVSTLCQYSLCVVGVVGQNVTLPCWYDRYSCGLLPSCWGREAVPRTKCSSTIISTRGGRVTDRASPRYELLSGMEDGNVSLTILRARRSDSGVYGCRVEVPGWFNDLKINIHLTVDTERTTQHESNRKSVAVLPTRQDPVATPTSRPRDKGQETLTILTVQTDSSSSHQAQQSLNVLLMHSAKTAAIFLIPPVAILVFILERRRRRRAERTSGPEENVYDDIQSFAS